MIDDHDVVSYCNPAAADQLLIRGRMVITNRSPIEQDGVTVGAVAVFQDGSELQSVLSRLDNTQNSLTNLESIFEQAYDGVMVVDSKGMITRITKSYCRFLNIEQEQAIGRHCTDILPNSRMHIVVRTGNGHAPSFERKWENHWRSGGCYYGLSWRYCLSRVA